MVELPLKIHLKWGENAQHKHHPKESREDSPHRNNPPEDIAKQGNFRKSFQL